ncbi:MAG: hypothetical protein CMJ83_03315 [Planctomycetes bacterium]|nr:hypothetical protein [Planctomycetota bacterium]
MTRSVKIVGGLILVLLVCGWSPAQGRHVMVLAPSQSSFTFSGQVTLPPLPSSNIVGQPNNQFSVVGTMDADLVVNAGTVTSAQLVPGGIAQTVPDLMAIVPNPLPFLPPLGTLNIVGVTLEFVSTDLAGVPTSFPVVNGTFSTMVVGRVLTGTAMVTALGMTQTINLAGTSAPPQVVTGALTSTPTGFVINTPVSASFTFMDPATGATGSLTLTGTLVADYQPLNSDVQTISVATGGVQTFRLSTGGPFGNDAYALLVSSSGTLPGINLGGGFVLPLNPDATFLYSIQNANLPPLGNTIGTLDGLGRAVATITIPPLPVAAAGVGFDFAYATVNPGLGTIGLVSNAFPLLLVP